MSTLPEALRPTDLRGTDLLEALEAGTVRAAHRVADSWVVDTGVKEGILELFRTSEVVPMGEFLDKEAFPVRRFSLEDGVRMVPGGSAVRRGAHLARGVVCMPPSYVNVGAWVGEGTMVDSHALVGSCAQVGARVHVSAGVQLGGVLEPIGARPVIIEDEVFLGAECAVLEGVRVERGAVLAAGVRLTASSLLFDLVHERELRGTREEPLVVPAGAVVVPGTRPAQGGWARARGLAITCHLIVKYRDERTDAATLLEQGLR